MSSAPSSACFFLATAGSAKACDERWEAVRGAFAMKGEGRVDNSRILLLDDGMTAGATLDACAKALREAGASSVLGLTVARAIRPVDPEVARF
jgi:predicted amidophosphoribosyltransferase